MQELDGQVTWSDLGISFGKMCLEPSVQTEERTSEPSLKKSAKSQTKAPLFLDLRKNGATQDASWEMGGVLLGEYTMPSFGESPRDAVESLLSQILEDSAHPKYCLSAKACRGILNRANRRGKDLPQNLKAALIRQSMMQEATEVGQ